MRTKEKEIIEEGVWSKDSLASAEDKAMRPSQWGLYHTDTFKALSVTRKALPAGAYTISRDNQDDQPLFFRKDVKADKSFILTEGVSVEMLKEIDEFWGRAQVFKDLGFLHSRGYLLYGAQGVGKSSIVQQIMASVIERGGIVFICGNPDFFMKGLKVFRQAEPDRPLVCVFEDIDAIIRKYGEDSLLSILDGANQVDRVLNIATTNYPESLDRRIISRPRRFDRVHKILAPSNKVRKDYLKSKLPKGEDVNVWATATNGLSFAAMTEALISVLCLGNGFDETIRILKDMENGHPSSSDFGQIGFGADDKEGASVGKNTSSRPSRSIDD